MNGVSRRLAVFWRNLEDFRTRVTPLVVFGLTLVSLGRLCTGYLAVPEMGSGQRSLPASSARRETDLNSPVRRETETATDVSTASKGKESRSSSEVLSVQHARAKVSETSQAVTPH